MIPQLASRSFAVENLFAPPFRFVSPAYQRPFAWSVDEAERLLADIQAASAASADEIYFLSTILLVRTPLPAEALRPLSPDTAFAGPERIFEIVDGQQRIVTLAILLAVLRDLLGPAARTLYDRLVAAQAALASRGPRVQLRGVDGAFLVHCMNERGACLVPPVLQPEGESQRRMLDVRDFFVRQLKPLEPEELKRLATFVLENCSLVAVVTNTIDRAFQMFTALNGTGKPLTRNDILKSDLIGQLEPQARARALAIWDDLERRLGSAFEQLFSFVRTGAGRGSTQIVEAIRTQVAAMPGGAAAFLFDTLAPAGTILDTVLRAEHSGAPQSAEINRLLRYLDWLPGREWVPPLLSYWARHGNNAQTLLVFLRALDRFAHGVRLQGLGADKRAQRMNALVAQINGGAPALGPWPSLQLSRDELRAISFSLRDLHRRSPQICRMVLLRLNEHLGGAPLTSAVPMTIEHILPLKVGANSKWRTDFPDAEDRLKYAACLGNLTLVTAAVNERASNLDFDKKHAIYFNADAYPVAAITSELRSKSTWNQRDIEQRLARFTAALNAIWQLEDAPEHA